MNAYIFASLKLFHEGPLRTKYRISLHQCYVANMNVMCNTSVKQRCPISPKEAQYNSKMFDITNQKMIDMKDVPYFMRSGSDFTRQEVKSFRSFVVVAIS